MQTYQAGAISSTESLEIQSLVLQYYQVGSIIGKGGSASVYTVLGSAGRLVVKLERDSHRALLQHECWIYSHLKGVVGVPSVEWYGKSGRYRALVMENAGTSLEYFLKRRQEEWPKKPTKYIVAFFAQEMLTIIKSVHQRGIVHGDIHPANFTIAFDSDESDLLVRLIDFGASALLGAPKVLKSEIPINFYFASARRLLSPGHGPSIADDLVSLAYTLIHLVNHFLPWGDLLGSSPLNLSTLAQSKIDFVPDPHLPLVYSRFLSYALDLKESATVQTIDYDAHIQAFDTYSLLNFTTRVKS